MNVIKLESQGVDPFTRCVTGSIYSWNSFGRNFIRFNILSLVLQEGGSFYHLSSTGNSSTKKIRPLNKSLSKIFQELYISSRKDWFFLSCFSFASQINLF